MESTARLNTATVRVRRLWVKMGIIVAAIVTALGCLVSLAPGASANTKSNWSKIVDGIEIGWTNDHAWAIANYATAIKIGAGEAAEIACDALTEEEGIGYACDQIVERVVARLLSGRPRVTNHGVWVALYPTVWGKFSLTEGAY